MWIICFNTKCPKCCVFKISMGSACFLFYLPDSFLLLSSYCSLLVALQVSVLCPSFAQTYLFLMLWT